MTVRRKTLLIIAITCLGLVVVLYAASRSFLLGGFIKLEQTSAREDVQRVLNALDQDLGSMDRSTYDRTSTDQTYEAMSNPTPEFIQSLLGKEGSGTIQTRRFNFVLLINASGHVIASRTENLATMNPIEITESLKKHISLTDSLFQFSSWNGKINGIMLLPEGPLLVISRPIIRPNTSGPIRGYMLIARFLDSIFRQGRLCPDSPGATWTGLLRPPNACSIAPATGFTARCRRGVILASRQAGLGD